MSKRSRNPDNSKRPQPVQQQRAQARQAGGNAPAKAEPSGQPRSRDSKDNGDKQR